MVLIERISHLKRACASKVVNLLLKNKFITHENKKRKKIVLPQLPLLLVSSN